MTASGTPSSPAPEHRFECPGCGKRYKWRDAFFGNELTCACGKSFLAPPPPESVEADSGEAGQAQTMRDVMSGVGATSPVLRALENREDDVKADRFRDVWAPWIMLPVGWFAFVVAASNVMDNWTEVAFVVGVDTLIGLLLLWPITFGAIVLVAQVFEKPVGTLGATLLKTAAIALGGALLPDIGFGAVLLNVDYEWWIPIVGFAFYVPTVVAPVALMFEFNTGEAAMVGVAVFLPKLTMAFMAPAFFPNVFP